MNKITISLISILALATSSFGAWKKQGSGTDYPTNSTPVAGDAFLLWDAGTNTTQNLYYSSLLSTMMGSPGTIGGVTPGTAVFTGTSVTTLDVSGAATFDSIDVRSATWLDNIRITFNPGVAAAGINVGSVAADPSTLVNGDIWYNSVGNALKARINGATVSLGSGGGSMATDTLWNVAGDLAYGTGSDTSTRLGIGTVGQLLQVNAGATAPEWTSNVSVTNVATTTNVTTPLVLLNEGAAPATPAANKVTFYAKSDGLIYGKDDAGAETALSNDVAALALKAPLASPTFTGTPAAPTASAGTSTTQLASTAFVQTEVDSTRTGTHASPSTTTPLSPTWSGPTTVVWYGVGGTINLPAASGYDGRGIMIYNTGAFTVTIDPNASEAVVRDGTVQTGGVSFTLSTGAGNYVALISDGTRWVTLGYKGTLTVGS